MNAMASAAFVGLARLDGVSVANRGLAYGDGVFETMRVHDGELPLWPGHLARLREGADQAVQRLRRAPVLLALVGRQLDRHHRHRQAERAGEAAGIVLDQLRRAGSADQQRLRAEPRYRIECRRLQQFRRLRRRPMVEDLAGPRRAASVLQRDTGVHEPFTSRH